jgi:hypothetical protein
MTGAFVRVYRDGKWRNVEFDQLTDSEMDKVANDDPEKGWMWAKFFAKWIRDNIKEL